METVVLDFSTVGDNEIVILFDFKSLKLEGYLVVDPPTFIS